MLLRFKSLDLLSVQPGYCEDSSLLLRLSLVLQNPQITWQISDRRRCCHCILPLEAFFASSFTTFVTLTISEFTTTARAGDFVYNSSWGYRINKGTFPAGCQKTRQAEDLDKTRSEKNDKEGRFYHASFVISGWRCCRNSLKPILNVTSFVNSRGFIV